MPLSTTPKIVTMPGDLSLGPGGTLTFTMRAPCDFLGRRLVIESIDLASGSNQVLIVQSILHDNHELVANGRFNGAPNSAFAPTVWRFEPVAGANGSATQTKTFCELHEAFCVGDVFSVTLFNPTVNNTQNFIYWITDYGDKCTCKKR